MHSNEINSICAVDDYLYLATTDGLHKIHQDAIKHSNFHLPIYITGVKVNEAYHSPEDSFRLDFSDNNIQLDYLALSYRNTGHQTYRHRMLGLEDNWVVNQKTNAQYPYLPAGSYVFEVSVQNGNGEWNPESARVEIVILKPYWAKMWFILIVGAFVVSFLILLFFWRIKIVKRRNQLIYDINWYQQEALINQMNPHFLFNSLNTVHRYVLQNDRVESSRYLTRFATLMRKILDMSQEKSLTIAKEIDALKLYLELESARFKDKFQFAIEVDPSIPQEQVLIPVFIIQPIVENAIWHGLMHSGRHGEIAIHFYRKAQNDLVVSIRDNGIGREEAEKLRNLSKPDQRKSLGLAIIKRRIALINTQEKSNISISYNDLKAADGSCEGTEVTVCFPNFLKSFSHETF
jgi:two-component sensor histidine kinase